MNIKISESHIKVYGYLKKLALTSKIIKIGYQEIEFAIKVSYPVIAKCMNDLLNIGCIKKLQDGKGRRAGGSVYTVDTEYKVFRSKENREKSYITKYVVTIIELKKI
jgi:predicted transcriptional regulator